MYREYLSYDAEQVLRALGIFGSFKKRVSGVLVTRCCFHNDRKPSLMVYPSQKRFHCYGCGEHGSMVDFVILFNNISEHPDVREEELKNFFAKVTDTTGARTKF